MSETPRVQKIETAVAAEPKTVEGKAILKEITSLGEKLKTLKEEKDRASRSIDAAKNAGRSTRAVAEMGDEVLDLSMRISSTEAELALLQAAYVRAEERGKTATYEPADERIRKLHVLLESCMQDIATLQSEQSALDASLEELNRELSLISGQYETLKNVQASEKNIASTESDELTSLEASMAGMQKRRDLLEERGLTIEFELEKHERYKEDLQVAYRKAAFPEEFRKTTH